MKFLSWLVRSSENPNNLSMTLKGTLGAVVSVVLLLAPMFHFKTDQGELEAIVDGIIQVVLGISALVSAIAGVVGLVRKIALSGNNPVELQTNPVDTKISDTPTIESPTPTTEVPPIDPTEPK